MAFSEFNVKNAIFARPRGFMSPSEGISIAEGVQVGKIFALSDDEIFLKNFPVAEGKSCANDKPGTWQPTVKKREKFS